MTQPITEHNHLSHTGVLLPAGRASFAVSSSRRMGLAHHSCARSGIRAALSFTFDASENFACQRSNARHRHPSSLSSVASSDGSETIGKRLDDGKILFSKTQKLHD